MHTAYFPSFPELSAEAASAEGCLGDTSFPHKLNRYSELVVGNGGFERCKPP